MEHVKELREKIIISNDKINDKTVISSLMDRVMKEELSIKEIASARQCGIRTAYRHYEKYKNNKAISTARGRPNLLDEESKITLVNKLNSMASEEKAATRDDFKELVIEGVNSTSERRNSYPQNKLPSISTMRHLREELDIRINHGQRSTSARQLAQQDIRNYVSVAAMHKAMSNQDRPELIFNFDATTYGTNNSDKWVVYPHKRGDNSPVTRIDDSGMQLFVKSYFYHNAVGDLGPLVLVVADDTMDSDSIETYALPGGSWRVRDSPGWIVFCKSREGNRMFFEWFLKVVVVPFVNKIREDYHSIYGKDAHVTVYIHCDGEQQQVDVVERSDIQGLLRENRIAIGKLPASCSGTTQASDVCAFFKASKARLANMTPKDWLNVDLQRNIAEIVSKHQFTTSKRVNLIHGILKVIATSRKTVTDSIIKAGYEAIGLYPFSLNMIMSSCKREIIADEFKRIESALPNLVSKFQLTGQLTEQDFDDENIAICIEVKGKCKLKDQKALSRQRAVNLTHAHTQERFQMQKNKNRTSNSVDLEARSVTRPLHHNFNNSSSIEKEETSIEAAAIQPNVLPIFMSRTGRPLKRKLKDIDC